jgi:predicted RNA-binding Zn ribbon-like protein
MIARMGATVASIVVDGLVIPIAITPHPALNFCNTRSGWGSPTPKEYLHTHEHVIVWARENGLLTESQTRWMHTAAATDPIGAANTVARAVAFRSALYAILVGGSGSAHWSAINREIHAATAALTLGPFSPDNPTPAVWSFPTPSGVDLPLHAIAWSAAQLLTSPTAAQVAACPGAGCGWVFADPRGRRRWCSMAWCGNRNKAARHAARARDHSA